MTLPTVGMNRLRTRLANRLTGTTLAAAVAAVIACNAGVASAADARVASVDASSANARSTSSQRPLRIDDLFRIEQLPVYFNLETDFSVDGKAFAFVRGRPRIDRRTIDGAGDIGAGGDSNGDVWVQLSPGAQLINVTQGAKAGDSGWLRPHWSPDGKALALMKTGRDASTLWMWNPGSRNLKQLSPLGIFRYMWLDEHRIIAETFPAGSRGAYQRAYGQPDIAVYGPELWAKAARGRESTASVLSSGVPIDVTKQPQGSLIVVDIRSGKVTTAARGSFGGAWTPSPTGTAAAYFTQVVAVAPQADKPLSMQQDEARYSFEVASLDGKVLLPSAASTMDGMRDLPRWSDNGKEVYYFAYGADRTAPPTLYRFTLGTQKPEVVELGDLDPMPASGAGFAWTPEGELIVLAAKRAGDKPATPGSRRDWWHLRKGGAPVNLTEGMAQVPTTLTPVAQPNGHIGVANGHVWRVSLTGKPVDIMPGFEEKIAAPLWTGSERVFPPKRSPATRMLVMARKGEDRPRFYSIKLADGTTTLISEPSEKSRYGGYSPVSGDAVFYETSRNGSYIWRTSPRAAKPELLVKTNEFLRGIAEGEFRWFEYNSLDGAPLNGVLILPVGYEKGMRYPLLTWVYSTTTYDQGYKDGTESSQSITQMSAYNMQLAAAQGYAVLMPSMPIQGDGMVGDALSELPNGVLPAVEKVIGDGIADPNRLFVMGQSFGGFSVYGLVTQTTRFKAAVAASGITDWVGDYGVFDPRFRYADDAAEQSVSVMTYAEAVGQVRLSVPPWKDYLRYVRNSPIFYVDRVQTPLMILHGDFDFVPMQQAEQFFQSLYRQGKRAEFVRYFGEGHTVDNYGNARDMWSRLFAWFDGQGDILRDAHGKIVFEGETAKSRGEAKALEPGDYLRFSSMFEPVKGAQSPGGSSAVQKQ